MKIDSTSVKNICGNSQEIVVYGLQSCYYTLICRLLYTINYKSYIYNDYYQACHYNTPPFKCVEPNYTYPTEKYFRSQCKANLANIVLENYKRSLKNEPLITLLFCVNYQNISDEKASANLSVEKTALSHSHQYQTVTDSELRRCYKLCNEMIGGNEIKEIANKTIKFVKVIKEAEIYRLEATQPFWQHPDWNTFWKTRKDHSTAKKEKSNSWRDALIEECKKIHSWYNDQETVFKHNG